MSQLHPNLPGLFLKMSVFVCRHARIYVCMLQAIRLPFDVPSKKWDDTKNGIPLLSRNVTKRTKRRKKTSDSSSNTRLAAGPKGTDSHTHSFLNTLAHTLIHPPFDPLAQYTYSLTNRRVPVHGDGLVPRTRC